MFVGKHLGLSLFVVCSTQRFTDVKVKVKQSRCRPGVAQSVAGS